MLTLNRPAARNSLSEAARRADRRRRDRATACAPWCSPATVRPSAPGHDLKELTGRRSDADGGRAYFQHIMTTCSAMMQQIVSLPQPVIAAVQGVATAAGCQLVASCDLAVASRTARLRHAGRRYRAVLLDADGGAVAQRRAQARDGDAADRRRRSRPKRPRASAWSIAWSRPAANATRRSRLRARSRRNRATS